MPPILPARFAPFVLTPRVTSAGIEVWRATCLVKGCPSHIEGAHKGDVREDAHDHRAAHVRGAIRLTNVTAATIGRAA